MDGEHTQKDLETVFINPLSNSQDRAVSGVNLQMRKPKAETISYKIYVEVKTGYQ